MLWQYGWPTPGSSEKYKSPTDWAAYNPMDSMSFSLVYPFFLNLFLYLGFLSISLLVLFVFVLFHWRVYSRLASCTLFLCLPSVSLWRNMPYVFVLTCYLLFSLWGNYLRPLSLRLGLFNGEIFMHNKNHFQIKIQSLLYMALSAEIFKNDFFVYGASSFLVFFL